MNPTPWSPPPELCSLILRYIPSSRRSDLLALLKTSKTFNQATEPVFYDYVIFTNVNRLQLFSRTIRNTPRLAAYVHTFGINLQELRARSSHPIDLLFIEVVMRREFWEIIQDALECMTRLEVLVLAQMQGVEMELTWMLDAPFEFRLREVKLHTSFDGYVASFLRRQSGLKVLQTYTYTPTSAGTIEPIYLPNLTKFDGSLIVAQHILSTSSPPPLTHLQLSVDPELDSDPTIDNTDMTLLLFPALTALSPTLRSLSLIDIPKSSSNPLFTHLANTPAIANSLVHLSHLHLPFPSPARSHDRIEFLGALIKFRRLQSIEVTMNAWDLSSPQQQQKMGPGVGLQTQTGQNQNQIPSPAAQKALVTEMKTYCPTLHTIVFWLGKTKFRWTFIPGGAPMQNPTADANEKTLVGGVGRKKCEGGDVLMITRLENAAVGGEWQNRMEVNQWPALSNLWCMS